MKIPNSDSHVTGLSVLDQLFQEKEEALSPLHACKGVGFFRHQVTKRLAKV